MRLKVKGLRAKNYPSGIRYYWEPTPAERKAKWTGLSLGSDMAEAIKAAEKRNEEIEDWKSGGAKPRAVARYRKRSTVGHGIQRYREEKLHRMAASTQRTASTPLNRLEQWAGDMPIAWVTRARVRALRDSLVKACEAKGQTTHPAFHVLERGRILWQWFLDEELATSNPFERFGLSKPPPRQAFWTDRELAELAPAAAACGWPSIGLAAELGYYAGQREADNLKMAITAWREIPRTKFRADPTLYDQLANSDGPDAGKVMGIYVRQGKTKRWVGIPVEGDTRRRIEAAIADAKAAGRMTILGNEKQAGKPWTQDGFIAAFGQVRAKAAELALERGDQDLAETIGDLWYGDLRRSCVVYLGELGLDDAAIAAITGHSLATIKSILETYMPRTEGMAARAVVARLQVRPSEADQERKAL